MIHTPALSAPTPTPTPIYLTSLDQSALDLACALVRYPSQTPDDAGCLGHLQMLLKDKGFDTDLVLFNDTKNLYARSGSKGPFLLFVGHVDVVPPGDLASWHSDPFTPTLRDGMLYGRGIADMKGAIACFLRAMLDSLQAGEGEGSVGLLLTSDEEGPGHDGVKRMVGWLRDKGEVIDHVLIGEPTGDVTGSVVQIGRRGSVTAQVTAHGVQSHIAYVDPRDNPALGLVHCLHDLATQTLDGAAPEPFPPTRLQVTALASDDIAVNVTPATARAAFGIRYGTSTCGDTLERTIRHTCQKHLGDGHTVVISQNGAPFLTRDEGWIACGKAAIAEVTGQQDIPVTTQGGTTDGRFMSALAPVIEIGLPQTTIHQVNESVAVQDLERLTSIYRTLLARYWSAMGRQP